MSNFQSMVERKLEPTGISGDDVIYVCPNPSCDDKSGHLYVNYGRGKYHCFKCGFRGRSIESLMKFIGIDVDYDYDKLYNEQSSELDAVISMKDTKVEQSVVDYSTDLDTLTEYYLAHVKPLSQQAYDYLIKRGLTPEVIRSLCMCEGINRYGEVLIIRGNEYPGRDYSGRIMIPSLRKDGRISFYLGRDYIGDKSNKYLNPPKDIAVASEDVWSLDIIETSTVIICEGCFTAVAVNNALGKITACATYGKSIAHKSSETNMRVTSQGEKLLSKKFHRYIIFYDKDALAEAYSNAMYLYERGADVRLVRIPHDMYGAHADAGDMTNQEIIDLILKSEDIDEFSNLRSSLTSISDTLL